MDTKFSYPLIAYIYFLAVGVSYLWGYWLPFEFNILYFVDITDVIKGSVYPLLPALGLFTVQAAMESFNTVSREGHYAHLRDPGFGGFLVRIAVALAVAFGVFVLGYIAYLLITEQGYQKLKAIFPVVSFGALFLLRDRTKFLIGLNKGLRFFALIMICGLPSVAFHSGNQTSNKTRQLEGTYWVLKAKEPCPDVTGELVFLARLGNKYLTMDKNDKTICVIENSNVHLVKATGEIAEAYWSVSSTARMVKSWIGSFIGHTTDTP